MRKITLILMAFGIIGIRASPETYVSGTITSDTTWNLGGSPYIVTDTSLIVYGTLNARQSFFYNYLYI